MQGFLDHIVLNIEDDETMIDFYTKVLMLPAERLEDYRAGEAPFPSVRINHHTVIDLFPKKLWEQGVSEGKGIPQPESLLSFPHQKGLGRLT